MINWYDLASRQGTISIKASSETQAKEEAAERWGLSEDEIVCTGHTPYYGARRLFA